MRHSGAGAEMRELRHPHRRPRAREGGHLLLLRALRRGGRRHRAARPRRRRRVIAITTQNVSSRRLQNTAADSVCSPPTQTPACRGLSTFKFAGSGQARSRRGNVIANIRQCSRACVMVPETRYARSGNLHIAYQVAGDGPVDLVFVHGWISHIEHLWEEPSLARLLNRLASFRSLILLDKRRSRLPAPVPLDKLPTLEERMDDLRAVMDAAGSERAALLGTSEAGALNLLFSATHPDRTAALILLNSYARLTWAEDYPCGLRPNDAE